MRSAYSALRNTLGRQIMVPPEFLRTVQLAQTWVSSPIGDGNAAPLAGEHRQSIPDPIVAGPVCHRPHRFLGRQSQFHADAEEVVVVTEHVSIKFGDLDPAC